ncbi:Clathrin/coatomer adaptor [Macleaya cordata]|uniref:AP-3 complex subunit delta n=1 Tax=Macleaya cordata TaxID=56857 RepID=A0A200Q3C5_MACCD|nr:Clathrin/coatomer adaptor [Macleaya cordata]
MAGSSIMESLFQRSLEDLIKGLRLQLMGGGESKFIAKSMEEIRREIKSTDIQTKSTALEKLTYLNSIHAIDMSWASFHVVEVMSSNKFAQKKIGYLAASQSFNESTDVILLITNQLRKDLTSTNQFEVGLALECLSVIATTDLARDLTPEIFTLLSSTKIFVKKKAVAVILRVFSKYPDAVRVSFKRLVENLESSNSDPAAAIGVFCELTSRDPRSYLPLAPEFYRILVDSKNNWVLIKVLKIFSELAPLEPRLAKRIVDPISEHMIRTASKSLMFECIRTVVTCLTDYETVLKLAVEKISEFFLSDNDDDPNLKYLGLQALSILASKEHLWAVVENKEFVIKSLSDMDPNIKFESLRLVMEMVSESNVAEITHVLVGYALKSDPEFCNEILGSILLTCSRNVYQVIVDFDWYVSLLGEMSRNPHCQKGEEIERQLVDICLRVREVRPELVRVARDLLIDPALLSNPYMHRILRAAAWVSGEHVEFSRNPFELMEALLQPRTHLLPPLIRAVYIQSAFKVLVFCLQSYLVQKEVISSSLDDLAPRGFGLHFDRNFPESSELSKQEASADCEQDGDFNPRLKRTAEDYTGDRIVANGQTSSSVSLENDPFTHESIVNLLHLIKRALGPLSGSDEVEVQERARSVLGLIDLMEQEIPGLLVREGSLKGEELQGLKVLDLIQHSFSKELGPVSLSAQERVLVPDTLLLKENLAELDTVCGDILLSPSSTFSLGNILFGEKNNTLQKEKESEPSTESTSLLAEHRKRHGLYYLSSTDKNGSGSNDYPPVNEMNNLIDGAQDLLKLTAQSVDSKKKSSYSKRRPMVVRLDDGDEEAGLAVEKTKDSKDDSLSGVVRDILLGDETKPMSSQSKPSGKSSGKRRVKEVTLNIGHPSQSKETLGEVEIPRQGSSNVHSSHGKERHRRSKKKDGDKDESSRKDKQMGHRRGRSKNQQSADIQTPAIPDYLL